jgi:hypothetical protein
MLDVSLPLRRGLDYGNSRTANRVSKGITMAGNTIERLYPTMSLEDELAEAERLALCELALADQTRAQAADIAWHAQQRLRAVEDARAMLEGRERPVIIFYDEPECWESLADV